MKFFVLALFFIPLTVYTQSNKWNPNHLDAKFINLEAEYVAPAILTFPFSSVKIIDSRFDTTKIGFTLANKILASKTNAYKKLKLKKGVALAIEEYYNDYYKKAFSNNGFELLIVIKKFWFSSFDAGKTKSQDRGYGNSTKRGSLLCKWEYYVGKENMYVPVKRTDTAFQLSDELKKSIKTDFEEKESRDLKFFLKLLMEAPNFEKKIMTFDEQPKKNIGEINEYNNKRFGITIIMDSIIKKGVYLNFDEFKANRPSITFFIEKKMKYGTLKKEEYLEDEKGNNINPFWGYSNGQWMKYGVYTHDYIYRVNNTFEFFSNETSFDITNNEPSSMTRTIKYDLLIPVQIDMETGEIY